MFERPHRKLLDLIGKACCIDWSRASLDSASIPAKRGEKADLNPVVPGQIRLQAAHRSLLC